MHSDKYLYVKKLIPFEPLQQIEDSWGVFDMPDTSKDHIKFLRREFKFIDIFLSLQSFSTDESNNMLHVTQKFQILFQDAGVKLSKVYRERLNVVYSMFLRRWNPIIDRLISQLQERIQMIKSDIRSKYSFPKISLLSPSKIVLEFVDAVLWILSDLAQIDETKGKIKEVLKELNLLRFFVCLVSNKHIEPQSCQHTFFTHVLAVTGHAAIVVWLHLPSHSNGNQGMAPSEMNHLLSDLLQMKIKPILPGIRKIYIDVLQALKSTIQSGLDPNKDAADSGCGTQSADSRLVSLKDQMVILREMLSLLRANLVHLPILDLEFHLQDMDIVIVNAGLLIYSLYDSEGEKEDAMLEDVNQALGPDLLRNIHHIKEMVYLIIRKAFQSNLPRIHGLGYVDFLLCNLEEFQGRYSGLLASVMNQLQIIQKELERAQPFLEDVVEQQHNKNITSSLIGKAYEVEYVVDACIRKELPDWCIERWLSDIIEDISLLRKKAVEIQEKKILNPASHDTIDTASTQTSSQLSRALMMNEEMVGFEDVTEELRDKLTKGCRELDVISIVGMPGLGKTTLAKKLYDDKSVVEHFDIRAQCCVSQVYKRVDLLLSILYDAIGMSPSSSTEDDVADKLRRTLLPKRYLILVDDVWETSAWDDVICCFEDANKGSRIILTTRNCEVAEYARFHSDPLNLRMFNDDESWELLKSKAIGEESCSHILEEVGRKIAIKCGGLPLSIVLVAGILAKMEEKEESWKQVATTLGSLIHNDSKAIVEQSYQDLSCHLKPCFLYFGAFLEDRVIDVTTLTRLWISEAFIKSRRGKRLEDIAEGYLDSLIGRNLVMVAQRDDSDGKVKACRLHDVLLEFCKERAKEENFLLWIKRDQNANPFSCIHSHTHHALRRLAFCEVDTLEEWSSSCSLVGSVLFRNDTTFFALKGVSLQHFTISRIFQTFKFLKVLDLEHNVIIDFFPTNLVHLRYFAAGTRQKSIPSSIANLRNLETLILYRENQVLLLPYTVWKMVKLRHLHTFHSSFEVGNAEELPEDSSKLNDLDTLSTPYFSCVKDAKLMLRKMPNIRELRCQFEGDIFKGFFERVQSHPFPILDFPTQLETLDIFGSIPFYISASNLKKLTLNYCKLDLERLSNIAQLPKLQSLELRSVGLGHVWKVSNDEVTQLKVLKLEYLSLIEWNVDNDAFSNLECLFLSYCTYLKGVPSCFGDICSLNYIEVENCNEIVAQSARDIGEKQVEDYQNTDFKLFIKEL